MATDKISLSQDRWRRYVWWILSHPIKVIAAVMAVTVLFGWQAIGLKLQNDRGLWLPQQHPYVEATRVIEEAFGGRNTVVIGIRPVEGDIYQPAVLAKILHLQQKILQIPESVARNTVSFAAPKIKSIRGVPEGMEVRRMLETIPQTAEELARLKQAVAANPFYVGALVSPDGRFAAVIADFKLAKDATGYTALNAAISKVVDSERSAEVELLVGGAPVAFATVEHYTFVAPLYFSAAFLIIMLVQYWAFRSLQGVLLPTVTGGMSVIWGLGVLGLLGYDLDVLNTTTPILITAIASGHAIQLLKRYYEEYQRLYDKEPQRPLAELSKEAIVESLTKIGSVMVIAGVIAAVTFYTLGISAHIEMVKHFGWFAGCGVLSGVILELTFIPALRSLLRPPTVREAARANAHGMLDRALLFLSAAVADTRARWVLAGGLAMVALVAAGIFRVHVDNSTLGYLAPDSRVRLDDRAINGALGGTNTVYFLVEGQRPDSMKDPKVLMAMQRLQSFLEQRPDMGKTQSLADLVKRMNQAMHNDDPAYFTLPQDSALIAQYLFLYSTSGGPDDFDNYVDSDYQNAVVWAFLKNDSTANAEKIFAEVRPMLEREFPKGVTVRIGGTLAESIAINDVMVREKLVNAAQMILVIFVLTSLVLRSVVGGLFVVTPVIIIVLANFGILGWLGIPLDMGTATTASMAISIGADYEIYLLYRFREELARNGDLRLATERALLSAGKAIVFIALSVAGGYAVLLGSDFAFYSRLATTVIATMIISALSATLFLRALMLAIKPGFVFGTRVSGVLNDVPTAQR